MEGVSTISTKGKREEEDGEWNGHRNYQVATLALRAYKVIFYKNYMSGPTFVWEDNDLMLALKEDTKV